MSEMILPRRKFLIGMAGLLAAPAIVRVESLMPVRSIKKLSMLQILDYAYGDVVSMDRVDVLYGTMQLEYNKFRSLQLNG